MPNRRQQQRILRATKAQVAARVRLLNPAFLADGSNIIAIERAPGIGFYEVTITTGFQTFGQIEQEIITFEQVDNIWIIDNLVRAVDANVRPAQIIDFRLSPLDINKIEVVLKREP